MRSELEQQYVDYVTARVEPWRRVAFLLCGDVHRADDLVQQTITKLYLHWARVSSITHLDQYVRTMLVREFLSEQRRSWAKVRLFGELPERPGNPVSGPEDGMVLRAALDRVPRKQRAVLVLRFLCDLPVDEVAEILGCSSGTVKSQTSHGLSALRRILAKDRSELPAFQVAR